MPIIFKIALRYLFSKKSINAINIIAGISTIGVAIASAALIIILSVFNGLEDIIVSRFNAFNPEIKISLNRGQYFHISDRLIQNLNQIENIKNYTFVLENYAAIKVGKVTHPFLIKGVDENYLKVCRLDTLLFDGEFKLKNKEEYYAVVGYEVAQKLSIGLGFITPMVVYAPKRTARTNINPVNAFNKKYLYPSAIYGVDESADNKILLSLELVQDLFEATNQASDVEISLIDPSLNEKTKKEIQKLFGDNFTIKNRKEQNSFYKILNSERLMIYLILGFVLLIAAFNIVATLTMLIVEKKNDFLTFKSIGLTTHQIKYIFLLNGWMTSLLGAIIGLILGGFIAFLQIKYGLISFGDGNFDIDAYPIAIQTGDFIKVFGLVMVIGFLTSLLPIRNFSKNYL